MLSVRHFRDLLENEIVFICGQCTSWQSVLHGEDKTIPEEERGKIQVAVGQAHLLVRKKFEQFRGLIDESEKSEGIKVTLADLQGFWDLLYIQVEDIRKKFTELDTSKKNNWQVSSEPERQPLASLNKNGNKVRPRKSVGAVKKDFSAEARERLALAKAAMKRLQEECGTENSLI